MLLWFVIGYLVISIGLGLMAAMRVHNSRDYIVAGRHLPMFMVFAMVFATWFGAETVLGISATFLTDGLSGLVSDPFGASLCLILFGLFFARPLYRMNLLTIGDFYHNRYNRPVEVITSICIALSYLGWVAAQITALGVVFNVLTDGGVSQSLGMVIGASVVLLYTLFGGMWSVAFTTAVQMVIIVLGLLFIAVLVSDQAGGVVTVVNHANEAGKFEFWPAFSAAEWLGFIAAWITMGFGSIPQQDVFQRVNSARSEKIAVHGTIIGGSAYFVFAAVPLFLAYAATLIDPEMVSRLIDEDSQLILPTLIKEHLPLYAQIIFYGALLSVIMSTASGTLLAPSVTISENVIKNLVGPMDDRRFLWLTRVVVASFAVLVTLYSLSSDTTIHHMVENAYKVTLVSAFIPLVFGIYWKRATTQGAMLAIVLGLGSWILMELFLPEGDSMWPPQLVGLLFAFVGMLAGSLLPQVYGRHHMTAAEESHI
ncbi:sodium:solute symporter family protein [Sulfurivermis fontis]|uniref:sodium:solute symporter family protein n=1 Tax=Sulfurivermis fontis TaxID=1972068 RepID=UPI000FDB5108|nr:sodium:solute symporter family protein [Sulfurivermis fontis]